jgi:hypothetical protein
VSYWAVRVGGLLVFAACVGFAAGALTGALLGIAAVALLVTLANV